MSVSKHATLCVVSGCVLAALASAAPTATTPSTPQGPTPWVGACSKILNRPVLEASLAAGTQFMLHNQLAAGNFTYEYDWVRKRYTRGDNQVRQAGALWGMSLIYQHDPTQAVGRALGRAFDFFERNSRLRKDGGRYVAYPLERVGKTGTVALVTLAHIDYLRAASGQLSPQRSARLRLRLREYLDMLLVLRRPDGLWTGGYDIETGTPQGPPSPYSDGEALLALVKAARYLGHDELRPIILASADAGYASHVRQALAKDPDSKTTKGYYQWSSMAFFELATSSWPNTRLYGDHVLELARWMIDVHETLRRTRNTAYAYEGILHAYRLARNRGDDKEAAMLGCVIEQGLEKLTSWQVGGPIPNAFLRSRPTNDVLAIGGVQNHRQEPLLRIDVAQHQMHAVILALRYYYGR